MTDSSQVYFSRYADDDEFIQYPVSLLDYFWSSALALRQEGDFQVVYETFVKYLNECLLKDLADSQNKDVSPKANIDLLAQRLMALSIVIDSLALWPQVDKLELKFQEGHARALDRQIGFYELVGDRALFFALFHRRLGLRCQASDGNESQQYVLPISKTASEADGNVHLSVVDLVTPVFVRLREQDVDSGDARAKLIAASAILFEAAETFLSLKDQLL